MKRRKWDSNTKAKIVLEVLQGRRLADVCIEYEISQAQYYGWREQFLSGCSKAFETKKDDAREQRLKMENGRLKQMVGELTVELKKTTFSTCKTQTAGSQDPQGSASSGTD